MTATDRDITRAQRLGRLAARTGRPVNCCPWDAGSHDPAMRTLARRFVAAFVAAGGTVDGLDYGDPQTPRQPTPTAADNEGTGWRGYETRDGDRGRYLSPEGGGAVIVAPHPPPRT